MIEDLPFSGIGRLLAMTPNDEANSLAVRQCSHLLERSQVYQLTFTRENAHHRRGFTKNRMGHRLKTAKRNLIKDMILVEPFPVVLALLPLIGYLLVLGTIRILGHALVTTGGRDIAALGVAISGFVAVGPAELFFPNAAATVFGAKIWIALVVFYALIVSLISLTSKPRLVVYGRSPADLYPPLLAAAKRIDPDAVAINGLRIHLPAKGIHFRLDGYRDADHAQVLAFEPGVPLQIWNQLLAAFREEVSKTPRPARRQGYLMLLSAAALIAILLWNGLEDQERVAQGFRAWLWR